MNYLLLYIDELDNIPKEICNILSTTKSIKTLRFI